MEDEPSFPTKRKLTEVDEQQKPLHKTKKLTRKCQPDHESLEISTSISKDRISELHNAVMQCILSFCSVKQAVSICTLSRQWKSLWTSMPKLLFHGGWTDDATKFASFIDKALMLYSAPKVKEFLLEFPFNNISFKDRVDSWLRFAATHEVEKFYLKSIGKFRIVLSDDVLGGGCWMSLKVLSLYGVRLGMEMIRSIFQGSPLMKSLTLIECTLIGGSNVIDATNTRLTNLVLDSFWVELPDSADRGYVEIKAPNLRSLTMVGDMQSTSLILVDVSSLVEANIGLRMRCCSASEKKTIKDMFEKLFHLNRLTVGAWVLQVLSIMRLDGEIIPASRCESLEIEMKLHNRYLPGMEALLDSSPYLEQLIMNVSPHAHVECTICRFKLPIGENYWRSKTRIFRCLSENLRRVEVVGFVPGHPRWNWNQILVGTMHFLLDYAKVLQKLIVHGKPDNQNRLLHIKEDLLSHPRASPNAQVKFTFS